MKKKIKYIIPIIIVALFLSYFIYESLSTASDIERMEKLFNSGNYKNDPSFVEHKYPDGSWIHILATDSHHGGGTIGVLESSGKKHYYTDHVCGFGEGVGIDYGGDSFDPNNTGCKKVK